MKFADLHLHTNFSDGTYEPEELVARAKGCGLDAISLTDHDTIEGCARTAKACRAEKIEFITGTELTAEHGEHEIHILGYGIDTNNPRLLAEMEKFQEVRQNRIRDIVMRLNDLKIPLEAEKVFEIANCRSPGRPHIARALVQGGFCSSFDEAFERFLKKNRPAWVGKFKIASEGAIELIHHAGGVAVLAHPGLNRTDEFIPELAEAGLDGIECFHTKHSMTVSNRYLGIAKQFGLLVTGGSDCHGMNKGKPLMGGVKIPCDYVEQLNVKIAARH